jgi:hypothetical protein
MTTEAFKIVGAAPSFRIERADGTLTRGHFHTQADAERWIADHTTPNYHRAHLRAHLLTSTNYAADNERRIGSHS